MIAEASEVLPHPLDPGEGRLRRSVLPFVAPSYTLYRLAQITGQLSIFGELANDLALTQGELCRKEKMSVLVRNVCGKLAVKLKFLVLFVSGGGVRTQRVPGRIYLANKS